MGRKRCDVVIASDPFKDSSGERPFLVVSDNNTPFHGEQYIVLSLTTRTWYEDRIPLEDEDWVDGGAPRSSSIMPWSVLSIDEDNIESYQGQIREEVVDEATAQLSEYIHK